ncbi:MAG: DNA recombination protein RmuC [Bacillota bacterium]
METLIGLLAVTLVLLLIFVVLLYRKTGGPDLSAVLQNLTQTVNANQVQTSVLAEKLAHLEALPQTVGGVHLELRSLAERVSTVEQNQQAVGRSLQNVATSLAQTGVTASTLLETAAKIQTELSRAKEGLTELQTHTKARQELEQRTADSIRRLEAIIAGTKTKGAAGENILEAVFAKLPPEWQVRDFRVGNKSVEFGLRLPNNMILPIDSKWPATSLLEQFAACGDPGGQQKLKERIEREVLTKAKEIKKYIDPNLTVSFGIVAVPDAVYDLCSGVQAEVFQQNVVLIGYSMFIPYLLLVFQTVLKTSQNIDLDKVMLSIQSIEEQVNWLQEELEGRFPRAITMLENSRKDISARISKIRSSLMSIQVSASVRELPGDSQSTGE